MATNGNLNHQDQYAVPSTATEGPATSGGTLPTDEVGWYFVEQYYTTLSKSPEKVHLYYGKRSQFVCGVEAQVTNVAVGRQAIQERIKALDFQDCKVRISNVDSQSSGETILIQVIGETSNKAGEPKKFVQTFVLAQQPSGYFVLNDILRYIDDEVDEEPEAPAADEKNPTQESAPTEPETEAEPEVLKAEESSAEKETKPSPVVIDKKPEEVNSSIKDTASSSAGETPADATTDIPETAKTETSEESLPDPDATIEEIAEEDVKKPETPQDPTPTPVAPVRVPAPAPAPAEPEKPKEPPKPMTWASRAAAAAGTPRAAVPLPKTATPPAPAQARPPVSTGAQAAAQPAQPAETSPAPAKDNGNEWQTAETKRQNRPQSMSAPPADKEGTMAYIKYVTEKVKAEDLRAALAAYGELAYFDINRQKNCAFVEFASQAGYNAAVAANPHTVNGESIVVEQRRPKSTAYGGVNYPATRGGAGRGGRGGFDGNRSGSQGSARGGFTGSTRARPGAPRGGRATPQSGNA